MESPRPGYLRLTLELARPESTGPLKGLGNLKVIEELLILSIGLRDPALPWVRVLEPARALETSR